MYCSCHRANLGLLVVNKNILLLGVCKLRYTFTQQKENNAHLMNI